MSYTASIVALAAISLCIVYMNRVHAAYASLKFLLNGRRMLIEAAEKHKDAPFSMLIPGNRLHLVSSKQHWNDLNSTSINHLSSHAWSKQHFQPKYTFGYEWPDRRDVDGMPVVRAVRTMTNQFLELKPKFIGIMSEELDHAFQANMLSNGSSKIPLWDTVKHFGSRINMLMMFGEDVANNPVTVDRGLKYIDETTLVGEVAKNLPTWLIPIAAWLIRGNNENQKHILDTIESETQKYYDALAFTPGYTHCKPKSILEALVQNLPEEKYAERIRFDMNTTFISSTTATPIMATQLLEDIYTHPEYLPALREEVKGVLDDPSANMTNLPLLENFLVESIRTHCFLATVIHRVPLQSYTFSDGYTVPAGEIVEFYQHKVMSDDSIYRDAKKFNPDRFKGTGKTSCDMGMEWPFWGNSKLACPGRFHVTNVAKLIAIYFIMNYDANFERNDNLSFHFRDVNVPNPAAKLILEKRKPS